MLNICSSVQDQNQSTIHKDSVLNKSKSKGILSKLSASGRNASEEMRLKKYV